MALLALGFLAHLLLAFTMAIDSDGYRRITAVLSLSTLFAALSVMGWLTARNSPKIPLWCVALSGAGLYFVDQVIFSGMLLLVYTTRWPVESPIELVFGFIGLATSFFIFMPVAAFVSVVAAVACRKYSRQLSDK